MWSRRTCVCWVTTQRHPPNCMTETGYLQNRKWLCVVFFIRMSKLCILQCTHTCTAHHRRRRWGGGFRGPEKQALALKKPEACENLGPVPAKPSNVDPTGSLSLLTISVRIRCGEIWPDHASCLLPQWYKTSQKEVPFYAQQTTCTCLFCWYLDFVQDRKLLCRSRLFEFISFYAFYVSLLFNFIIFVSL